jgi:hypothetical protein
MKSKKFEDPLAPYAMMIIAVTHFYATGHPWHATALVFYVMLSVGLKLKGQS